MTKLYHKDVYMPPRLKAQVIEMGRIHLIYTRHALSRGNSYTPPVPEKRYILVCDMDLVEVEVDRGRVVKAVLRERYNESDDLVLVVVIPTGYVKTQWLISKDDHHSNLKVWRYENEQAQSNYFA